MAGSTAGPQWSLRLLLLGAVLGAGGCSRIDYEARAQIVDAISYATAAGFAVDEVYAANGQFPDAAIAERLTQGMRKTVRYEVRILPDTGVIELTFAKGSFKSVQGKVLYLEPVTGGRRLKWRCRSDDISSDDLPLQCQRI